MPQIITVISPKSGQGTTTVAMNLALSFAQNQKRVCIVDMSLDEAVRVSKILEIDYQEVEYTVNDFLNNRCEIEDTLIKVDIKSAPHIQERVFVAFFAIKAKEFQPIKKMGIDFNGFNEWLSKLSNSTIHQFDFIVIDSMHGFNEERLLLMAISDITIVNVDQINYQSAEPTILDAKKLNVPTLLLTVNKAHNTFSKEDLTELENKFKCSLPIIIPNTHEINTELGVFVINNPNHPITKVFQKCALYISENRLSGGDFIRVLQEDELAMLFYKLRVFLCHASQDKPVVRELYQKLLTEGWLDPWLDEEKLLPGQDWDMEIEKAVEAADAVIVCVSNNSVSKEGYVQRELKFALDVAFEKPEGTIFIVPLRLDDCNLPRRLRAWQYVDYFPELQRDRAYQRLLKSLKIRISDSEEQIQEAPAKPVEEKINLDNNIVNYSVELSKRLPSKTKSDTRWLNGFWIEHKTILIIGLLTASISFFITPIIFIAPYVSSIGAGAAGFINVIRRKDIKRAVEGGYNGALAGGIVGVFIVFFQAVFWAFAWIIILVSTISEDVTAPTYTDIGLSIPPTFGFWLLNGFLHMIFSLATGSFLGIIASGINNSIDKK